MNVFQLPNNFTLCLDFFFHFQNHLKAIDVQLHSFPSEFKSGIFGCMVPTQVTRRGKSGTDRCRCERSPRPPPPSSSVGGSKDRVHDLTPAVFTKEQGTKYTKSTTGIR